MNSNIFRNVRNAIVIRSHQVENGATGATAGLASDFFDKTGALEVGVSLVFMRHHPSSPLEVHRPILSSQMELRSRKP